MDFPVPAIVFLCVLCGCIVVLCIVYQLLKRDMCCNIEAGNGEAEKQTKNGYTELTDNFYEFDETEGRTTDEDPQSRKSSRRSSRRSSYDLTATSQSGGELTIGDSASNLTGNESIDIRISGPEDDMTRQAGKLLLEFNYSISTQQVAVTVIKAAEVPSKARGGASAIQIRMVLLPNRNQRFKTKVRPASNPIFNETFSFMYIDQLAINQSSIRIRIYGQERYNQGRLIGELILHLRDIDLSIGRDEEERKIWFPLLPRSLTSADSMFDLSDSTSVASFGSPLLGGSNQSLTSHSSAPELLVSLCYASLTGRLTVEVLKASNLRYLQMQRAPDTYVKVSMFNSVGQQLAKSKTSIRRSMFDPEYNETFVFQIIEFDLANVSLMFSIVNIKKMRRKEIVGWFSIGSENTSEEELIHWREMLEGRGKKVRKWHILSAVNRSFDDYDF
ncbi:synaptotagmin-16-like isoform X3 [Hydractinia symbiolongicarpus]|uniref:synaptotagmin-16-like isoform X3 n=1 Tax=Hydractinia symbiolongicarpus TaxID=13093 RepID=UPI00254AC90B|nr:synaptotagmin-16-like isoform X3 [Hydractinia symbiolongicarpus]